MMGDQASEVQRIHIGLVGLFLSGRFCGQARKFGTEILAMSLCVVAQSVAMNSLPEWTDLRYFLELARSGTLSGAARRLAVDHTTVARRIQRLEAELKTPLFDHRREGYELTEMGQVLLPHAEAMESVVTAASEQMAGQKVAVRGVVRLGAPEVFGSMVLAPRIAELLEANPDLRVDLLLLPRFANLANREADLGIMLDPPETGRYMVTRLLSFRYYLYASPAYLARYPAIKDKNDLKDHCFVDYVQDHLMSNGLNYLDDFGFSPKRRFCATGMLAQIEAATAGVGIMMMPLYAVPTDGSLVPVLPDTVFADRAMWLVAPTDLYRLKRVNIVWDWMRDIVANTPELFMRQAQGDAPAADTVAAA
jgi:DNA-binding transcriptional LysR family regulator